MYLLICCFTDTIYANEATVAKEEVFVYNLGTMFYINRVLFATPDTLPPIPHETTASTPTIPPLNFTGRPTPTLPEDVESLPEELEVDVGDFPDVLLQDENPGRTEATTPGLVDASPGTESTP